MMGGRGRTPPLRKRNKMCRARATARVAPTGGWQEVRGVLRMSLLRRTKFPRCLMADVPNFDRGHWLRPTVVPADWRPLSWPPIGWHFLEIASLILPQAALRRFPRFIRHRRRSDRSPRARSALAMTGFLARGVEKRGVQEAAPYGCMAGKCSAQGITDCHSQCAH